MTRRNNGPCPPAQDAHSPGQHENSHAVEQNRFSHYRLDKKSQSVATGCNSFVPSNMSVNGRIGRIIALSPTELGAVDVGGCLIRRLPVRAYRRPHSEVATRCNSSAPPNTSVNGRIDRIIALSPTELRAEDVGGGLFRRLSVRAQGR